LLKVNLHQGEVEVDPYERVARIKAGGGATSSMP
jgi:hypothetical protein